MSLEVLYQSKNFIVVNKSPDIIINTDEPNRISLQKQLATAFPHLVISKLHYGFYFPHRLDFATSGVICIALNKKSCAAASSAFQNRTAKKFYVALLRGHVTSDKLDIDAPIGEVEETDNKVMIVHGRNSRSALSKLMVLERGYYCSYPATKVLILPLTGRRHQLRVHCQYIGHTIVGDYTYSKKNDLQPPRMFLHSYRLKMPNMFESVDVSTSDPFVCQKIPEWEPTEYVRPLDQNTMEYISINV